MNQTIDTFNTISLTEMKDVKLMDRIDQKFWFDINLLHELLIEIQDHYYILEIDGKKSQSYHTTYFDTDDDVMYNNHHRGKLNRYKIRRRKYALTHDSFLEVKFKNNKGHTIKNRIECDFDNENEAINAEEMDFIAQNTPYSHTELNKALTTNFNRLMLVNKKMNERCTIDTDLTFMYEDDKVELDHFAILEVKSERNTKSEIINILKEKRIKPSGFSKYCIGRSLMNHNLKSNFFKVKHREIEKYIHLSK